MFYVSYCAVNYVILILGGVETRPLREWKHDAVFEAEFPLWPLSLQIVSGYCCADDSVFVLPMGQSGKSKN